MKKHLQHIANMIDGRTLRERGLLFLVVIAVVFFLWQTLLMDPLQARQKNIRTTLDDVKARIAETQQNMLAHTKRGKLDLDESNRKQLAKLDIQHLQLDQEIQRFTAGLIPPQKMTRVLEEMLKREDDLSLVRLQNHQIKRELEVNGQQESSPEDPAPYVYQHGITLEFTGTYADTLHYLQQLEQMDWTLYWDLVEITMNHYPQAHVTITVYTLSLEEGWIRV